MTKWKKYFLSVCNTVAANSSCLSRHIGAIIVRDKSIISTGYNGPPRGIPNCSDRWEHALDINLFKLMSQIKKDLPLGVCPRKILGYGSGQGLELCVAGHAERNALINAAREGVSVKGATMYMSCNIPCKDCLIEIINAGIKKIVVAQISYYDETSKYLIAQSDLEIDTFENEGD